PPTFFRRYRSGVFLPKWHFLGHELSLLLACSPLASNSPLQLGAIARENVTCRSGPADGLEDQPMADELAGSNPQETLRVLHDANAILKADHFVFVSGDHGSGWIEKDAIYPHTERIEQLGRLLGRAVQAHSIDVVCGPATGGLILAEWAAHELG